MTTNIASSRFHSPSRREWLGTSARVAALLAAAGLLPGVAHAAAYNAKAFDAASVADALKALGAAGAPVESREVTLAAPDIAENGAQVQVAAATTLAGVKRLAVLVEKNPAALAAAFEPSEAVEAAFTTRLKLAESSQVYAVAMLADGRVLFARKEVKVTLGGCG